VARRVLIVDDEESIVDYLRLGLQYEGFDVLTATSGVVALDRAQAMLPDLIILDVMLPQLDGLEVCRRLRGLYRTSQIPILMLTVRDQVAERVAGLEAGADDYLTKPFAYIELLARVRALLRRAARDAAAVDEPLLSHRGLTLDRASRETSREGVPLELTAREFDLLALLLANAGRVLSRDQILEKVWGYGFEGDSHIVDVYVHYLRQKLGPPNLIQAVRGVGFVIR
jgi:two-component system, OmpR family, response regulator MprA